MAVQRDFNHLRSLNPLQNETSVQSHFALLSPQLGGFSWVQRGGATAFLLRILYAGPGHHQNRHWLTKCRRAQGSNPRACGMMLAVMVAVLVLTYPVRLRKTHNTRIIQAQT